MILYDLTIVSDKQGLEAREIFNQNHDLAFHKFLLFISVMIMSTWNEHDLGVDRNYVRHKGILYQNKEQFMETRK